MTDAEKILMVKSLTDETDDNVISAFLSFAGETVYKYVDPFKKSNKEAVLEANASTQVKIAAYYISKRGWDFQISHSENGVVRTYEVGDVPQSILRELTPLAGVVS